MVKTKKKIYFLVIHWWHCECVQSLDVFIFHSILFYIIHLTSYLASIHVSFYFGLYLLWIYFILYIIHSSFHHSFSLILVSHVRVLVDWNYFRTYKDRVGGGKNEYLWYIDSFFHSFIIVSFCHCFNNEKKKSQISWISKAGLLIC